VVERVSGRISEARFSSLGQYLKPRDLLVLNDTRVIPARLFGKFEDSDCGVEILLLKKISPCRWICLGKPLRRFKPGKKIIFSAKLWAGVVGRCGSQEAELQFNLEAAEFKQALGEVAVMPIPPYIRAGHGDEKDRSDYQTIFAKNDGSVAAPTASLHFTADLLQAIREQGVETCFLTLHVGSASFLPIFQDERSMLRPPGAEVFQASAALQEVLKSTRRQDGRVVAVGTTVVRALESFQAASEHFQETSLFIMPGYKFRYVDALVTNFHQPGTTHLLLVEALIGRDLLAKAYDFALHNSFRFLSYGDAMLIV
jgi:S-adenosylmethionine:tRNA ribosyltransferase-isomerase